jgi:hypothetical protein
MVLLEPMDRREHAHPLPFIPLIRYRIVHRIRIPPREHVSQLVMQITQMQTIRSLTNSVCTNIQFGS